MNLLKIFICFIVILSCQQALSQGKIIHQKDGVILTEETLSKSFKLVEFFINKKLTDQEKLLLTLDEIKELNKNTQQYNQNMETTLNLWTELQNKKDPVEVGVVKLGLLAEFYKHMGQMPQKEIPYVLELIFSHVKVISYDEENNVFLTDNAIESYILLTVFINKITTGKSIDFTPQMVEQTKQQLITEFKKMTVEQKKLMCIMEVLFTHIYNLWEKADDVGRKKIIATLSEKPVNPVNPENPEAEMGSFTYDITNQIMLDNHLTNMNIIENMGGTGNYWEAVYQ